MKAEQLGDHGRGELGGQLDQCGVADGSWVDAELLEAVAEVPAAELVAGAGVSGEQPLSGSGGRSVVGGGSVPKPKDEGVEGWREFQGFGSEGDGQLVVGLDDIAGRDSDDAAEWLAEQKQKQAGDPDGQVEVVVVQEFL